MKKQLFWFLVFLFVIGGTAACGGTRNTDVTINLPAITPPAGAGQADMAATVQAAATTAAAQIAQVAPSVEAVGAAEVAEVVETVEEAAVAGSKGSASTETSAATATAVPTTATTAEQAPAPETITATDMASLQAKVGAVQVAEGGTASIVITDDELNAAMQAGQQANPNPVVSNPNVLFTGGAIVFSAGISQPASGTLVVNFRPYVTNGLLQFEVISATFDGRRVPPATLEAAEQTLNATLAQALNQLPANVQLTNVIMGEGTMELVVASG